MLYLCIFNFVFVFINLYAMDRKRLDGNCKDANFYAFSAGLNLMASIACVPGLPW
jgi:hypothetical protein